MDVHLQYVTISRQNKTKQENAWRSTLFAPSRADYLVFATQYQTDIERLIAIGVDVDADKEREIFLYAFRDHAIMKQFVLKVEARDELTKSPSSMIDLYSEAKAYALEHSISGTMSRQAAPPAAFYNDSFSGRSNRDKPTDEEVSLEECNNWKKGTCKQGSKCCRRHIGPAGTVSNNPKGAAGQPKTAGAGAEWKKTAECFYCGKKGHIKSDCKTFKSDKESGNVKEDKIKRPSTSEGEAKRGRRGKKEKATDGSSFSTADDTYPPAATQLRPRLRRRSRSSKPLRHLS